GTVSQNDVEARSDVLVYSTPLLDHDVEVTGPISADLFVSASSPSADVTAKLVDVHEDGVAYNVSDGIFRGKFDAHAHPAAATRITVELWPTSMVFRHGHRIRLEIAGSNFPRFDRDPHTGEPSATARTMVAATQMLHHNRDYPSSLTLPLVPDR